MHPNEIKKHRYKHAEGKRWIEVSVSKTQQLFDARDPAPFRQRDLDDDFVEYILSSVREFSMSTPLKIVLYIEEKETSELSKESLREAIKTYFSYKIDLQTSELKAFAKRAQFFLLVGLLVLALCITIAQSLVVPNSSTIIGIIREGIVIFGWVSIWKPIELILFDWFPIWELIRFYRKILNSEVEIQFATPPKIK